MPVPLEKEVTIIDKNGEEVTKNTSYILQFINSTRFMASSLSNLVNNDGHDDKTSETCRIKYRYCDCFFEYTNFKDDLIE